MELNEEESKMSGLVPTKRERHESMGEPMDEESGVDFSRAFRKEQLKSSARISFGLNRGTGNRSVSKSMGLSDGSLEEKQELTEPSPSSRFKIQHQRIQSQKLQKKEISDEEANDIYQRLMNQSSKRYPPILNK